MAKRTTGSMLKLAIPKRGGNITWTLNGQPIASIKCQRRDGYIELGYLKDEVPHRQQIALQYTPCHYGGCREWFTCPNCSRRCGVLYGTPFYCRQCHRLAYTSTVNSEAERLFERMEKIRYRLKVPTLETSRRTASPKECAGAHSTACKDGCKIACTKKPACLGFGSGHAEQGYSPTLGSPP